MYFYLWNQWQILPEKSLIRIFRLLLTFYNIQYLRSYGKSNLGSCLINLPYPPYFLWYKRFSHEL